MSQALSFQRGTLHGIPHTPHLLRCMYLTCTANGRTLMKDDVKGAHEIMSPPKTLERSSEKTARLEARITEQQKTLFMRAAELTGRSLTDFVVASAQETASRTLREHDTLMLSTLDRKAFVEALLHPPVAAARLRKAVVRYRERRPRRGNGR